VAYVFCFDGYGDVFFAVVGSDGWFLASFGVLACLAEAFEELALAGWEASS
jgi:hypothetical protein